MNPQSPSSARIDISMQTNATFAQGFQIGTPGDTSWSFTGQSFRMDIKQNKFLSGSALVSLTSGAGQIVVDDAVNRILHFNVPESVFIAGSVIPGEYDYDLIMISGDATPVRVPLMYGKFRMGEGVSGG